MIFKNRTERIKSIAVATLASSALLLTVGCDSPTVSEAEAPTSEATESAAERMAIDKPPAQAEPMPAAGEEARAPELQERPTPAQPGTAAPSAPGGAPGATEAGQQVQPGAATPPGAAEGGAKVTDKELKAFVVLAPEVQRLEKTYRDKMSAAQTAEEASEIREEASAEVKKAFEKAPLEPEEFSAIAARMSADPALQARAQAFAGE